MYRSRHSCSLKQTPARSYFVHLTYAGKPSTSKYGIVKYSYEYSIDGFGRPTCAKLPCGLDRRNSGHSLKSVPALAVPFSTLATSLMAVVDEHAQRHGLME